MIDDIKITALPFESRTYIIFNGNGYSMSKVKEWLDTYTPELYSVTGENMITFKTKQAETIFVLRWM